MRWRSATRPASRPRWWSGGAALLAKAVVLPAPLATVVTRTREARSIASERHPLARLTVALAAALALVALVPRFGLESSAAETAAVGLVALGIASAVVRGPAIFQALGFLVAENGLYLAALAAPGGVPAFIELGLVLDLVVIVSVAGVQRQDPRGARHRRYVAARGPA